MNRNTLPILALAVVLLAGCQGLFQTVVTVTEVRDEAMKELAKLSKAGLLTAEQDTNITRADFAYVKAASVAERSLVSYKNGGDRAEFVAALTALKAAAGELIAILNPLNTKAALKLETNLAKASKP